MNWLRVEYEVFASCPREMRALVVANTIYALVLPVIEIFVAAYVMHNSHQASKVMLYQLNVYAAVPLAFVINGLLLKRIAPNQLYAAGMILSSGALIVLVTSDIRTGTVIALSGVLMGLATGLFWANRGLLALSTTTNRNRNYYYGVETSVITIVSVVVPGVVGWLIDTAGRSSAVENAWSHGYRMVAFISLVLTIVAGAAMQAVKFSIPSQARFVFFGFHPLWRELLVLASLKGMAQSYIVTAPALLILKLVGKEGTLGTVEAAGSLLASLCLYTLGRKSGPTHRILVLAAGLILFLAGSIVNCVLFNAAGVLVFTGCMLLAKPLLDLAYYPLQFLITDIVSNIEGRSRYAYIVNHEFGIFAGRCLGCGLFLVIASYVSDTAALKYALPVVAVLQLPSAMIASKLVKQALLLQLTVRASSEYSETT